MLKPGANLAAPQQTKKSFPKSRRLLRHVDFERVYRTGKRHFAKHMTVFFLRREIDEQHAAGAGMRVGFTIRKVLGGAVERNRMKRRLREAVRLQDLPNAAVDVVINPKPSLLKADFSELKAEVAKALQVIEKSQERAQ
jgi:ribonuclease P protein component